MILRSLCKVAKVTVYISMSVHPSVPLSTLSSICLSRGTQKTLDEFTWHFTLRSVCSKMCPENSHLVNIAKNHKQFI